MTKDNEDALRCAERLERSAASVTKLDNLLGLPQAKHGRVDRDKNAAAHLRRLVAENEAKDALLRQAEMTMEHAAQWLENDEAETQLSAFTGCQNALAAIRQHLEGKA